MQALQAFKMIRRNQCDIRRLQYSSQKKPAAATVPVLLPVLAGDHSEAFFTQRIQDLQSQIQQQLPTLPALAKEMFITACKSLQDALDSKSKAMDLYNKLQKEAKADDATIKQAQAAVDAAQVVVDDSMALVSGTAQPLLNYLNMKVVEEAVLLECTVLVQATAKGLADFCAENSNANGPLVDAFLQSPTDMKRMILNGGACHGLYGPALEICAAICKKLPLDAPEVHHKLALATCLELASPIGIRSGSKDEFVDPVQRFWHYAHAYDAGELDDAFEHFSPWELRLVVDSDAPNDQLQWGRDYMKAYRPDEVLMKDENWRYCYATRSDVGYRHPDGPSHSYQDIISNGGECGPRAWFGRFACKAFGIPTWGVKQPGHAVSLISRQVQAIDALCEISSLTFHCHLPYASISPFFFLYHPR
jgi:hypothetical protein